jgi:hypothetical protein
MSGASLTPTLSPSLTLPRSREREEWGQAGRGRISVGAVIFVALVLSLALAGCGKRNAPQLPPDAPDTYPRPYPSE